MWQLQCQGIIYGQIEGGAGRRSSGVLKLLCLPGNFPLREGATLEMPTRTPSPFLFKVLPKAEQRALPQAT